MFCARTPLVLVCGFAGAPLTVAFSEELFGRPWRGVLGSSRVVSVVVGPSSACPSVGVPTARVGHSAISNNASRNKTMLRIRKLRQKVSNLLSVRHDIGIPFGVNLQPPECIREHHTERMAINAIARAVSFTQFSLERLCTLTISSQSQ